MSKKLIASKEIWKSDIVYYDKITKESASLILDQIKALLEETVDTAKSISLKAEKIITIVLPIASAILAYLINSIPKHGITLLTLSAIFAFIVLCISLGYSYQNFKHYEIAVPGISPKTVLNSKFINTTYKEWEQYANLVMVIGENIQDRIEINDSLNSSRTRNNRIAIKILFGVILCPVFAWIALLLYHYCHS